MIAAHEYRQTEIVILDQEYVGKESIIRSVLHRCGVRAKDLRFGHVGKASPAHHHAIEVFRSKKASKLLRASEVLRALKKSGLLE